MNESSPKRIRSTDAPCSLLIKPCAKVAELADAPDLGSGGETHGGSTPPFRTNKLEEIMGRKITKDKVIRSLTTECPKSSVLWERQCEYVKHSLNH